MIRVLKRKAYTEKVLSLFDAVTPVLHICESLGLSRPTVYKILRENGRSPRGFILSPESPYILECLNSRRYSAREIARKAGTSTAVVSRVARDHNITIRPQRRWKVRSSSWSQVATEHDAYWLGFAMADGYVRIKHRAKGTHEYLFRLHIQRRDVEHLNKLREYLGTDAPIRNSRNRVHPSVTLEIWNKEIVHNLSRLGCTPRKSDREQFPNIREDLFRHFLRGYFDGDGWFTTEPSGRTRLGLLGGRSFLVKIRDRLVALLGIYRGQVQKLGNIHRFLTGSNADAVKVARFMYDGSTVYLDRKYQNHKRVENGNNGCNQEEVR